MTRLFPGVIALALSGALMTGSAAASDPDCTASYGGAAPHSGAPIRFGVDPGIAGSAGGVQLPSVPDDLAKDLAALRQLRPPGKALVLRLNRMFWSDGNAGIARFQRTANQDSKAGFDVEIQVRYHPADGEAGNIPAWLAYVRHVVDSFGPNRHVVAMTITNEVNLSVSPNTSDGAYAGAKDALIQGIEAAHDEALKRGDTQLRFGFTYAYRFAPNDDAAFFSYLGAHGGPRFTAALGFVGVDFYPGTIYPPAMAPGDTYRAEFAQAAAVVRDCFAPMAGIGARVPIWITENGVPTGALSGAQQADALRQLVQAAHDYSGTFNITDYRWFNLRDSTESPPGTLVGPTFSSDGLLTSDYTPKPSFGAYRTLIGQLGASETRPVTHKRHKRHKRHRGHKRHKRGRQPRRHHRT
ncbi:MAG TPA: hypothetical protein VGI87_04165 [Solirubrobacteraceae bacterium]